MHRHYRRKKIPTTGEGLVRFRRFYKLSQGELGREIGYSQGRISQLEAGGRLLKLPDNFKKTLGIWQQKLEPVLPLQKQREKKDVALRRAPRSGKGLKRLLDKLESKGIGKEEVAKHCNVSMNTLLQYQSKKDGKLNSKFRERIGDFLGLTPPKKCASKEKKYKETQGDTTPKKRALKKKHKETAFATFLQGDTPLRILRKYNPSDELEVIAEKAKNILEHEFDRRNWPPLLREYKLYGVWWKMSPNVAATIMSGNSFQLDYRKGGKRAKYDRFYWMSHEGRVSKYFFALEDAIAWYINTLQADLDRARKKVDLEK